MTIYDALLESHEAQRTLLDLLVKTEGASEERTELLERVRAELDTHATAEERCFYVPLMQDGETQEEARHSVHEHEQLEELLEEVEDADQSTSAFLAAAKKLQDKVIHHLDEEEEDVFPAAKKVLSEDRAKELGEEYRALVEELKHGTDDPMALKNKE